MQVRFHCLGINPKFHSGAFGVANNCDWVASQVRKSSAGADVRCVMDGLDFFPMSHLVPGCNPFVIRNLAAQFWKAEVDQSCQEANREDSTKCLVFTSSHQYIETPFMVIVPFQDTNNQVHLFSKLMNSILEAKTFYQRNLFMDHTFKDKACRCGYAPRT